MRRCIQICLLLICATSNFLQAQSPSSNDRVESILGKMSLEEKIDYIGGTGFANSCDAQSAIACIRDVGWPAGGAQ